MSRHVAKLVCVLVMILVLLTESVQGVPSSFRIALVVDSQPYQSSVTSSILNYTVSGAWSRHSAAGGQSPCPTTTILTLSSACQLGTTDAATLLALVANTADASATAVSSIVFASTCALRDALPPSVIASGVPILHAPPIASPVAAAWSQGSAVSPSTVQKQSDTAATAPARHFVRSDAVFSAHDSGLFALIGAAQTLLADQQWQRVALLTTADAAGASAIDIMSLLAAQTATMAPAVAITAQMVDSAANNMTAAVAALFSVANPQRVVMLYLPRGFLASAVSALYAASAFGKGFAMVIVAQDAAFDPVWTSGDPSTLLSALSAAPSSTVFGGYHNPPLNTTQASGVLSGALIAQSAASLALQSSGSVSTYVNGAPWLSAVVGTLDSAGKMQLACVYDLVSAALQAASDLVGSVVTPAVNNPNQIANGWASSVLSRQMRAISISGSVSGSLSFSMSPSAWLAGWNQSATLSGAAIVNGTTMTAFDTLALALSATRAAHNVTLVNYVAIGVSTAASQSLSLSVTGQFSLRSLAASVVNAWSALSIMSSTVARSASSWSPYSWPNARLLSPPTSSGMSVSFVFNGTGIVSKPPSARRHFIALQQLDTAIAAIAVRMAISDGSAFSAATGDTVEWDETRALFQDACESTGLTATAQATMLASAASPPVVAVVGCTCSSSSVAAALVYGAASPPIPLISTKSTSPALSNATRFPYFLRLVRSDTSQASALISFVNRFGWSRVACIGTSDVYGTQGCAAIQTLTTLQSSPIVTLALTEIIGTSTPQETSAQIQAKALSHIGQASVSVIIVFCSIASQPALFDAIFAAGMYGSKFVYLFSDSVTSSAYTTTSKEDSARRFEVMKGSFYTDISAGTGTYAQEMFRNTFAANYPSPAQLTAQLVNSAAHVYQSVGILSSALAAATIAAGGARPSSVQVMTALRSYTGSGALGYLSFDPLTNDRAQSVFDVYNVNGIVHQRVAGVTQSLVAAASASSTPALDIARQDLASAFQPSVASPILPSTVLPPLPTDASNPSGTLTNTSSTRSTIDSFELSTSTKIMWPGAATAPPTFRMLYVGGIGDTGNLQSLNYQLTAKWAVDHINAGSFLPGGDQLVMPQSMLLNDACSPTQAAIVGARVRDFRAQSTITTLADGTNITYLVKRPIALIGTDCSSTLGVEAPLSPSTLFISGWATAASLGNRDVYPNVLRTIPSDASVVASAMSMVRRIGWKRIGVIGTNDLFGTSGVAGVVSAAAALNIFVQVAAIFPVGAPDAAVRDRLQQFKDAGCHIIIMFVSRLERCRVLALAQSMDMYGRRWIGSDVGTGVASDSPTSGYVYISAAEAFICYDGTIAVTPAYRTALDQIATSVFCIIAGPMLRSSFAAAWRAKFGTASKIQFSVYYDAMWLLANGLRNLALDGVNIDSVSAADLHAAVRGVNFVGMSGPISFNAANAAYANDRQGGDFLLFNIRGAGSQNIWGSFSGSADLAFQPSSSLAIWALPMFGSSGGNFSFPVGNGCVAIDRSQIPPISCSAGTFANINASAFNSGSGIVTFSCDPCPAGSFAPANRFQCTPCPADMMCPFAAPLPFPASPPPAWKHCLQSTRPLNDSNIGNLNTWTTQNLLWTHIMYFFLLVLTAIVVWVGIRFALGRHGVQDLLVRLDFLHARSIVNADGGVIVIKTSTGGAASVVEFIGYAIIVSYLVQLFLRSQYTIGSTLNFSLHPDQTPAGGFAPVFTSLATSCDAASASSVSSMSNTDFKSMTLSWQVTLIGMDEAHSSCAATCAAAAVSTVSSAGALSESITGRFDCAPVAALAGCRVTFTAQPASPSWILPNQVRISFAFNATRAHALEWRADNVYTRAAFSQSLTNTLEANDGSVLFGAEINTVILNYQYTRVETVAQPPSLGYSAFFASKSATVQVDATNYYLQNQSSVSAPSPSAIPGVKFDFVLLRSDQMAILTQVAGNQFVVFNAILSFCSILSLVLAYGIKLIDATRVRLTRKEEKTDLNCCEARVLEFLRAWFATSIDSSRAVKVAVQIGATPTSSSSNSSDDARKIEVVSPPMPEVVSERPARSAAAESGGGRVGLVDDAGIELQDMSPINVGAPSATARESAANAPSGGESTAARNEYLNARPSWMRSPQAQ